MNITERHIVAIDRALAVGCTIDLNGVEYTFSPLTLGDLADILQWRRDAHLRSYLASSKGVKVDRAERFADLYDIQHRAARAEDYSPQDPSGLAYMAWLSLKKKHPRLELKDVEKLVADGEVAELVADVLKIESGVDPTANPTEPAEEAT